MPTRTVRDVAAIVALVLVLLYAGYLVADLYRGVDRYQWDFGTYYSAAKAYRSGLDPYEPGALERVIAQEMLPFVYPPFALKLFAPLAALRYETAARLWLSLKLLCLAGMIMLWRRFLFPDVHPLVWALYLLLAFGGTLYLDLRSGNVSILEQAVLWTGLILILRGQVWWFCGCVLAASMFKLSPVLFLLLVPLLSGDRGLRPAITTLVAFILLQLLQFAWNPPLYAHFLTAATAVRETGASENPSTYALIRDLAAGMGEWLSFDISSAVVTAVYLAVVGAVVWVTRRSWGPATQRGPAADTLGTVCLFCCTYALVLPRFKSYSFILLLPAGLYVLRRCREWSTEGFLLALMLLAVPPMRSSPPLSDRLYTYLWTYYPLLVTALCWGVLLRARQSESSGVRIQ